MPKAKYQKEKSNGLYFVNIPTGEYDTHGKPAYKKLRAKTIAALDAKVDEYKKNKTLGIKPDNTTVDQWYETWITTYKSGCKETTREWYKGLYKKHVKPFIGELKLSAVKEAQCQKIISAMTNASAQTQKDVRYVMTSLFSTAARNHLIFGNPAKDIAIKSRKPKKKRRSLTETEREDYLFACKELEFGVFPAFLYYLGLRRGECLALTSNDIKKDSIVINKHYVYPKNNLPQLSTPKSDAGYRELPIPLGLRPYISRIAHKDGLLFSDDLGQPLTYTMISDRWNKFINAALGDETEVTMHYIRHNYCTMLFEQGVDLQTAQYLMGHEDIETTMKIYAHYTEMIRKNNTAAVINIGQTAKKSDTDTEKDSIGVTA